MKCLNYDRIIAERKRHTKPRSGVEVSEMASGQYPGRKLVDPMFAIPELLLPKGVLLRVRWDPEENKTSTTQDFQIRPLSGLSRLFSQPHNDL